MAELQLGGKVIATQSGANNPVLASNVVMDNVNVNNALASATFPAGHVIQMKNTTVKESSQHTSTSYTDTNLAVSIIPKKIGSLLLISFGFTYGNSTNSTNDVRLKKTINGIVTLQAITKDIDLWDNPLSNVAIQNSAAQGIWQYNTTLVDTVTSLNQIDFVVVAARTGGTLNIGGRNDNNDDCQSAHYITVCEVAQ